MGVAQSKNVASAITNVANYVSNSTQANTDAVTSIKNSVDIDQCSILLQKDFNINTFSENVQKSSQILTATQDTTIQNDIKQKMLQEAQSKVGTLGIGYASATNETSMLCNVTNQVIQAMIGSITQVATVKNNFTCYKSTIVAQNLNVSFASSTDFLAEQTLDNRQTTDIVNTVSQESKQKATATVEGMAGLLIALALIIGAIGYSVSKPLASSSKIVIVPITGFLFVIIFLWLYLAKAPPFFNEYLYVSVNNPKWGGDCSSNDLIGVQTKSLKLSEPPLKYNFPLTPRADSLNKGNLISFFISNLKIDKDQMNIKGNGGYNFKNYQMIGYKMSNSNKYYLNLDESHKLYEKVFAGYDKPEQYQLPCPLIPINNGKYYAKMATEFIECCNPVIVQFTNEFDLQTGNISDNQMLLSTKCDSFPKDGKCNNCCGSINFEFNKWVDSGDAYRTEMNKIQDSRRYENIICQFIPDVFDSYLNTGDDKLRKRKILYARFLLCESIGIENLDVYIDDYEPIFFRTKENEEVYDIAKNQKDKCYKYTDFSTANLTQGLNGGGTITGQFGICNNQSYKIQSFCKKIGGYLLIIIIIFVLLFMGIRKPPKFKKQNLKKEEKKNQK